MNMKVKMALGLMIVITTLFINSLSYKLGYIDGESHAHENSLVKRPIEYGIGKSYSAEKLETEPESWYTPDELGIVLIKSSHFEVYHIYIAREHEDRALAWMRNGEFKPEAIKYGDQFYEISFLWVTPELPESINPLLVRVVLILAIGWVVTALIFVGSKAREWTIERAQVLSVLSPASDYYV